jgi:hypothetical protein
VSILSIFLVRLPACALEPSHTFPTVTHQLGVHRRLAGGICRAEAGYVPLHSALLCGGSHISAYIRLLAPVEQGLRPSLREPWQLPKRDLHLQWWVEPI